MAVFGPHARFLSDFLPFPVSVHVRLPFDIIFVYLSPFSLVVCRFIMADRPLKKWRIYKLFSRSFSTSTEPEYEYISDGAKTRQKSILGAEMGDFGFEKLAS